MTTGTEVLPHRSVFESVLHGPLYLGCSCLLAMRIGLCQRGVPHVLDGSRVDWSFESVFCMDHCTLAICVLLAMHVGQCRAGFLLSWMGAASIGLCVCVAWTIVPRPFMFATR